MTTPLEVELKQYAHNLVATYVMGEYDSQIGKWQRYINQMVDAQTAAMKQHQKVLDDVRKQIQEQIEAAFGLAMLALSFVGGAAVSWVAGKIQYTLFPKFASSSKLRERAVWLNRIGRQSNDPAMYQFAEMNADHDKVWAKVFGDLGKQIAAPGIDKLISVATADSKPAQNAVQTAASSDRTSFKTNLENALLLEADLTRKAILSVANGINENSEYGAQCLAKLKTKNAKIGNPKIKTDDKELELLAKAMIREDINALRKDWADKWLYYGYDPGSNTGLAEAIELELWGLWILNEQLRADIQDVTDSIDDVTVAKIPVVIGKTFGDRGIPEGVLIRLAEFGVIEARTQLQKLRAIAAQEAREMMEAQKEKELRDTEDAIDDLEDSRSPDPQLARLRRAAQRAVRRNQPSQPHVSRPDPERPLITVGSRLDTEDEIDEIEDWAKNHQPKLVGGSMSRLKRPLASIEKIFVATPP